MIPSTSSLSSLKTIPLPARMTSWFPSCKSSDYYTKTSGNETKFHYDLDFDLKALKKSLMSRDCMDESGYQSVLERSTHSNFGTGWMFAEDGVSLDSSDDWANKSGAHTRDGFPLMTFPDSRVQISYSNYYLLMTYLLQVPPMEDSHKGYVLVIDRRMDTWKSIHTFCLQLSNYFPASVRTVFLLKPEGVLQRALEFGYKNIVESCKYKLVVCQNVRQLKDFIGRDFLTVDLSDSLKYNHLEWVQHRMDIERMKSSAMVIAQSLSDFGRCLRDTELPNDAETTAKLLERQTFDSDSIKEDFRISTRKGLALLHRVRQLELIPNHEHLSPTCLHNVTAIERMLVQLDETEHSFDRFWTGHRHRLEQCLGLRRFEEAFRRRQSDFAKHMIHLEEHRNIGDGPEKTTELILVHNDYALEVAESVESAKQLRIAGEELMSNQDAALSGSLLPKCEELARMVEVLTSSLEKRTAVLDLSKNMHQQISSANEWCKQGVNILSSGCYDLSPDSAASSLLQMEDFLLESESMKLDTLKSERADDLNQLILLTTTETSTLLTQVVERMNDVRRMCISRKEVLQKIQDKELKKPMSMANSERKTDKKMDKNIKRKIEVLHDFLPSESSPTTTNLLTIPDNQCSSLTSFVAAELLATEKTYVQELRSVVEHYIIPFDSVENPVEIRGEAGRIFGNLEQLVGFHELEFLPDLETIGGNFAEIGRCFLTRKEKFFELYCGYCRRNKGESREARKRREGCSFFADCQKRAGHPLPLSAYLLKPVQRITKYHLLLKELRKHLGEKAGVQIDVALDSMLDLLTQLNAAMHPLNIVAYPGDLANLGPLRLQGECYISSLNKRKQRKNTNKAQRRHLFLFDKSLLLCKKRTQLGSSSNEHEYFEHKSHFVTSTLSLSPCSSKETASQKLQLWQLEKEYGFAIQPVDSGSSFYLRSWITVLDKILKNERENFENGTQSRPLSWTSNDSNVSFRSSSTENTSFSLEANVPDGTRISNENGQKVSKLSSTKFDENNIPVVFSSVKISESIGFAYSLPITEIFSKLN